MESNPEPRPSKLLLANSVIVIGACMFLVAFGISGLMTTWDPCAMFGGLIIIPLPALCGYQQYVATFKRRADSAAMASGLANTISVFAILFSTGVTAVFLLDGKLPPLDISLMPLVFAAPFITAGYLNRRWGRELRASGFQPADKRFRISVRELLAMTAFIGAMLAMTMTFVRGAPKQFGVNVTADEAGVHLPENASRVSYAHGFRGSIAYEFDTDEASFRKWVEGGIGEIETGPVNGPIWEIDARDGITITRFTAFTGEAQGPGMILIQDGVFCRTQSSDQWIHAAFDRKTNRAYYNANYH